MALISIRAQNPAFVNKMQAHFNEKQSGRGDFHRDSNREKWRKNDSVHVSQEYISIYFDFFLSDSQSLLFRMCSP